MDSLKNTSRIAGLLYLVVAITGLFGLMYVGSKLIVSGDAAQTARNILDNVTLYKAGIVSGLICQLAYLLLALALYKLFSHVDKTHAVVMVAFVVVAVPIAFSNSVNELAALKLLSGDEYLKVFTTEQLHAHVMLFQKLDGQGFLVAEIFWGLWLFPLGYLVYKSNMFPKIPGVLLMIACFCYLLDFFVSIFASELKTFVIPANILSTLAEFVMIFFLLRGPKEQSKVVSNTNLQTSSSF